MAAAEPGPLNDWYHFGRLHVLITLPQDQRTFFAAIPAILTTEQP